MGRYDDFGDEDFGDLYGDGEDPIRGYVPEPPKYRRTLVFAIIVIALVLAWYLLGMPTPVGLGLP